MYVDHFPDIVEIVEDNSANFRKMTKFPLRQDSLDVNK